MHFYMLAIREKKQIRIIGDYDVDGICSTYVLYHALQLLGASGQLPDPAPDQGWVRTERRDHPGVQRAAGRSDRHL